MCTGVSLTAPYSQTGNNAAPDHANPRQRDQRPQAAVSEALRDQPRGSTCRGSAHRPRAVRSPRTPAAQGAPLPASLAGQPRAWAGASCPSDRGMCATHFSFTVSSLKMCTVSVLLDADRNMPSMLKAREQMLTHLRAGGAGSRRRPRRGRGPRNPPGGGRWSQQGGPATGARAPLAS